jgi:glutaminase
VPERDHERIQAVLDAAVETARRNREGMPATYIPELANVPLGVTSAAVMLADGTCIQSGDVDAPPFTYQSSAKLVVLGGLLEERGPVEVFDIVGSEPSGDAFASVARLETHGPKPANPLINSGAIALCGQLPGSVAERLEWLSRWAERLYGTRLGIDRQVFESERVTGDRNRALAYFLKSGGVLTGDVDATLDVYFSLCSLRGSVAQASHLPALLACGGLEPGRAERVLSKATAAIMVSLMATCGMYNESGNYLVSTGMPAKSGVSGVIVAVVPGTAGVAVYSPRLNDKGGSVRGHIILRELSRHLRWHFALVHDERDAPALAPPDGLGAASEPPSPSPLPVT